MNEHRTSDRISACKQNKIYSSLFYLIMSAFKILKDVCIIGNEEIQRSTAELFAAKVDESFEDNISKKLRDLSLFRSKLNLLRAKPLALNSQIQETQNDGDIMLNYSEQAADKVIEQQLVKTLAYSEHVQTLLTTPDSRLDPDLIDRKLKIMNQLAKYRHHETELRSLMSLLTEKEAELAEVQREWEGEMQEFREMRGSVTREGSLEETEPVHKKLKTLLGKMKLMRWLISRLVTSRVNQYDWLEDPAAKLKALKLTRQHCTSDKYMQ